MLDWSEDLPSWPLAEHSRQVAVRPHVWHVQEAGAGPCLLLLHGAGGATHSWRGLLPDLARDHRVVAIDLPGHGFTRFGTRQRSGLRHMSDDIAALAEAEGWRPSAIIGHSAGAALALSVATRLGDSAGRLPLVIGLNAALAPFEGVAGWMLPTMAKLMVLNPLVPGLFALSAGTPERVRQLIDGTGSQLDANGIALYARLLGDPTHVGAALQMMAAWDLGPLVERLPGLAVPTVLIAAAGDRAVPPKVSRRAAEILPDGQLRLLDGLGHLAHEERPDLLAQEIRDALDRHAAR